MINNYYIEYLLIILLLIITICVIYYFISKNSQSNTTNTDETDGNDLTSAFKTDCKIELKEVENGCKNGFKKFIITNYIQPKNKGMSCYSKYKDLYELTSIPEINDIVYKKDESCNSKDCKLDFKEVEMGKCADGLRENKIITYDSEKNGGIGCINKYNEVYNLTDSPEVNQSVFLKKPFCNRVDCNLELEEILGDPTKCIYGYKGYRIKKYIPSSNGGESCLSKYGKLYYYDGSPTQFTSDGKGYSIPFKIITDYEKYLKVGYTVFKEDENCVTKYCDYDYIFNGCKNDIYGQIGINVIYRVTSPSKNLGYCPGDGAKDTIRDNGLYNQYCN